MTWFEAYMLWKLGAFITFFTVVAVVSTITSIVLWICRSACLSDGREGAIRDLKTMAPWRWLTTIIMAIFLPLAIFLPSTETLLKIIATKKGVEAIQSDTAAKYLGEVDKTITNGLKVLNQEIEKKLDKKVSK